MDKSKAGKMNNYTKMQQHEKNYTIGICLAGVGIRYQLTLSNHLNNEAKKAGCRLLYFSVFSHEPSDDGFCEAKIYDLIPFDILDALIIYSKTIKNEEILNCIITKAKSYGLPIISLDKKIKGCHNIMFNYKEAMVEIVSHMIKVHGCRRFEYIGGVKGMPFFQEREKAVLKVLESNDICIEPMRFHNVDNKGNTNTVYKIMDGVLDGKKALADVFICVNDTTAVMVHKRLTEEGYQIPKDVLVTGFDGIEQAALMVPAITTAVQDFEAAASLAIHILMELCRGNKVAMDHYVDFKIKFRGSCGCGNEASFHQGIFLSDSYLRMDNFYKIAKNISSMTNSLLEEDTMEDAIRKIPAYVPFLNACKFWIAIAKDEQSILQRNRQGNKVSQIRETSNLNFVRLCCFKNNETIYDITEFPAANLIYNLEQELIDCNNLMFVPLNVSNAIVGYMAVGVKDTWNDFNIYQIFSMTLSTALQSVKFQMEQHLIIQQLDYEYSHDILTGIYNRRGFQQMLDDIFAECLRIKKKLMLISIDMDGLKYINDTFGHSCGDEAMIVLADTLRKVVGEDYICARFGGDEFMIAGMINKEEDAGRCDEDLKRMLTQYNKSSGKPYRVEVSTGVLTAIPQKWDKIGEFIRIADSFMYHQKEEHRKMSNYKTK